MEVRRIALFMALFVLAVSQYSDAHSMRRRQAYEDDDMFDDVQGDEGNDEEAQNDPEAQESEKPKIPAQILSSPTNVEVEAGVELRLPCNVSPEATVVQWYKNNEPYFLGTMTLHEEPRYSIDKSKEFVIKNAEASDNGIYRCEILQKDAVSVNHSVLVLEPPMVNNMTASKMVAMEGSDLTVTCNVTGSPQPTVLWSLTRKDRPNERLTEKDGEYSVDGTLFSLHIPKVTQDHAGEYYCYAFNKPGSHQAELTIKVNPLPRVHVGRTIVNSDIGIEAELECAAHEFNSSHIRWYKDSKLIEDSEPNFTVTTRGAHSKLTVTPTTDSDFGTFTCEAENEFGKHNRSIELVQRPIVEELQVEGAKLSWVVHSHQALEEMEIQIRPVSEEGEWKQFQVPIPEANHHKYETSYLLDDKGLDSTEYMVYVKAKNTKSWGGSVDPVIVKIEVPEPQYIQHASVFRNSGESIRPTFAVVSTVLMYLLVRML